MTTLAEGFTQFQEPDLDQSERQILLKYLSERFNLNELKDLVYVLVGNTDKFDNTTIGNYARETVSYFIREKNLRPLLTMALEQRPDPLVEAIRKRLLQPIRANFDYLRTSSVDLSYRLEKAEKELESLRAQLSQSRSSNPKDLNGSGGLFLEQTLAEAEAKRDVLQDETQIRKVKLTSTVSTGTTQSSPLLSHYNKLLGTLLEGKVVTILGPGVNTFDRPRDVVWQRDSPFAPTTRELAIYLAAQYNYPYLSNADVPDLSRISQYVSVMTQDGPLQDDLQKLFRTKYAPNGLHHFLARLPSYIHTHNPTAPYPIFITTSYDDLLEQAFKQVGQPYDLLSYTVEDIQTQRVRLAHWPYASKKYYFIDDVNKYSRLKFDQQPLILKLHRIFDNFWSGQSRLVITEDHFIDYMRMADSELPKVLLGQLINYSQLFLGYDLTDWSLRVMLHRIWGDQRRSSYTSWAVGSPITPLEQKFWDRWQVEPLEADLETYILGLSRFLDEK